MEVEEVWAICTERLGRFCVHLLKEHATPVGLVGVGHDYNSGKIVICTTEDMSTEDIAMFLVGAIKELGKEGGNDGK